MRTTILAVSLILSCLTSASCLPPVSRESIPGRQQKAPTAGGTRVGDFQSSNFNGLKSWQRKLAQIGFKLKCIKHRQLFGGSRVVNFDQVAFLEPRYIVLNPAQDDESNNAYVVDTAANPRTAIKIKSTGWPADFVSDGQKLIEHTDGSVYRVFYFGDESIPKVNGVEKINPTTKTAERLEIEKVPAGVLNRFYTCRLTDEVPGPDSTPVPSYKGPWEVYNWRGGRVGSVRADLQNLIVPGSERLYSRANAVFICAQTVPATAIATNSRIFKGIDAQYGFDTGTATVYELRDTGSKTGFTPVSVSAKNLPPLSVLLEHIESQETRDAVPLPRNLGVAYVWRGLGAHPESKSAMNNLKRYSDAYSGDPAAWGRLPIEVFDVRALVIKWADGSLDLVDMQVNYLRQSKIILDAEEAVERGLKANEFYEYEWQYRWDLADDGTIRETTVSSADRIEPDHILSSVAMRLAPVDVINSRYLSYFKGRSVWIADIQDLIRLRDKVR